MGLTYSLKDISCEAASALWLWESVEVQRFPNCFTSTSQSSPKIFKVKSFNVLKKKTKKKSEAGLVPNYSHI